jgi:hypothetical protein
VTKLAEANWSTAARNADKPPELQPELVVSIYNDELGGAADRAPSHKRIMLLEISQYLENYLWPHFDAASASFEHVMSILIMLNEKFREGVPAWGCFHTREVRPALPAPGAGGRRPRCRPPGAGAGGCPPCQHSQPLTQAPAVPSRTPSPRCSSASWASRRSAR